MSIIIANKHLISQAREQNFTRGKQYRTIDSFQKEITIDKITENTRVLDDQGDVHQLGFWYKHFKFKK